MDNKSICSYSSPGIRCLKLYSDGGWLANYSLNTIDFTSDGPIETLTAGDDDSFTWTDDQ